MAKNPRRATAQGHKPDGALDPRRANRGMLPEAPHAVRRERRDPATGPHGAESDALARKSPLKKKAVVYPTPSTRPGKGSLTDSRRLTGARRFSPLLTSRRRSSLRINTAPLDGCVMG